MLFDAIITLIERRRNHLRLSMSVSSNTSISILVLKKQSSASAGRQTTGSFSLNEVFNTIGTPVKPRNASMRRW